MKAEKFKQKHPDITSVPDSLNNRERKQLLAANRKDKNGKDKKSKKKKEG